MGLILVPAFNSTGTVLAQKNVDKEVATTEMVSRALDLRSVTDMAVYAEDGVSDKGNSTVANGYRARWSRSEKDDANRNDLANSFSAINQLPCSEVADTNLTDKTFGPGVYCMTSAQLSGRMVFDAGNDPNAVFVVRVAGSMSTTKGSSIGLLGDAQAASIFFVAGDSIIIGEATDVKGNLIARNNIGIGADAMVDGRALSVKGEVALSGNSILGPQQTGILEICKEIDTAGGTGLEDRTFNFRVGATNFEVPVGQCSGPITVPSGPIVVEELLTGRRISTGASLPAAEASRFQLVRVRTLGDTPPSSLTAVNLPLRTANVNVRAGDIRNQTRLAFTNRFAITAIVEICKEALDSGVTGFFNFVIDEVRNGDGTVVGGGVRNTDGSLPVFIAPVGQCTGPITVVVPASATTTPTGSPRLGSVLIGELNRTGFLFTSATAFGTADPRNRLLGFQATPGDANFMGVVGAIVREGGTDFQTTVVVNNRSTPAALKICKIAGPGIPELTNFTFEVNGRVALPAVNGVVPVGSQASGPIRVDVLAGPAATGGFCQIVGAPGTVDGVRFVVDTLASVTETGPMTTPGVTGEIRVVRITSSSGIVGTSAGAPSPAAPNPTTGTVSPTTGAATTLPGFGQQGGAVVGGSPFNTTTGTGAATSGNRAPGAPIFPGQTGTGANTVASRTVLVPIVREVAEVEFVNIAFSPVPLKICKVAGPGVAVGTPFTFTVTADPVGGLVTPTATPFTTTLTVLAGPVGTGPGTQNGFCDFVGGPFGGSFAGAPNGAIINGFNTFNAGSTVTIRETGFGTTVINPGGITSPTGGVIADTTNRTAVISSMINNVNEVQFVNSIAPAQPVKSRKRARLL
jgi:hypothetical protein